jgi:NitT/TauT family transport system ATP-binding protein
LTARRPYDNDFIGDFSHLGAQFRMIAADQSLARSSGRGVSASISLANVEKIYGGPSGDLHAIAPLSIELPAGEAVSIVGPSGCGKSTLMRLIAGLDAPTRGEIRIGEQPVAGPVPGIGIVFQRDLLLDWRKVLGNVLLPAEIKGLGGLEARARELLQEFDVGAFADSYPWQLSGGMRQRVAIARALLTRPALLFLDEPFSALDALTRDQMNVLLQRVQTSEGVTTLLITHSITEAIFCADRVLVMSGRPGAIMDDIRVPFERPRRLAIRETAEFTAIGRRIREHFEKVGVLVG